MSAGKPAIKDISINLTNAPQELMLGTKKYPLNFTIMNLRNEVKDLSIEFVSSSLNMDTATCDLKLAPQEKKNVTLTVSPKKDGAQELSITITLKRTIKYTETVLEGQENERVKIPAPEPAAMKPSAITWMPTLIGTPTIRPICRGRKVRRSGCSILRWT